MFQPWKSDNGAVLPWEYLPAEAGTYHVGQALNLDATTGHLAAVAADLLTGREVVLDRGGLYDAIRASISIPSVFRPVRRGTMVLVDGGTVNPLPLNRVRREPGDVLVAVDVSAPFSEEMAVRNKASLNYYKVITASSEIMQQHIARLMCKLYKPDLLIEMPADRFGIFEFYRAREIVEAGRMATRAALERSLVEAG